MKQTFLILGILGLMLSCAGAPEVQETEPDGLQRGDITITLKNVSASEVYLSGSFNGWALDEDPFFETGEGEWEITKFFRSGKHQFKLIIDGQWTTPDTGLIIEPRPSDYIDDGFGGLNAVYDVR